MSSSTDKLSFSFISQKISEVLQRGDVAVLATVVSNARNVGSRLLVDRDGASFGQLGSEKLDAAVREFATTFLTSGEEMRLFAA